MVPEIYYSDFLMQFLIEQANQIKDTRVKIKILQNLKNYGNEFWQAFISELIVEVAR